MNTNTRLELRAKAARLADLIARAKPAQIRFSSEEQFLQMLGLPKNAVAARVELPGYHSGKRRY